MSRITLQNTFVSKQFEKSPTFIQIFKQAKFLCLKKIIFS